MTGPEIVIWGEGTHDYNVAIRSTLRLIVGGQKAILNRGTLPTDTVYNPFGTGKPATELAADESEHTLETLPGGALANTGVVLTSEPEAGKNNSVEPSLAADDNNNVAPLGETPAAASTTEEQLQSVPEAAASAGVVAVKGLSRWRRLLTGEDNPRWRSAAVVAATLAVAFALPAVANVISGETKPKQRPSVTILDNGASSIREGGGIPVVTEAPLAPPDETSTVQNITISEFTGKISPRTGLLEGTPLHALAEYYLKHGIPFDIRSEKFQTGARALVAFNGYKDDTRIPTGTVFLIPPTS